MSQRFEKHFTECYLDVKSLIKDWPTDLNKDDVIKFVSYNDANMIFVPIIMFNEQEVISRNYYYCSICKKWNKISDSIKNIKRHAFIHLPELFQKNTEQQNSKFLNENQEKNFLKNIVAFILFETNSFRLIESQFLKNISTKMISKEKLVLALSNISKYTRQEIKSNLLYSSANYITFDQWTDHKNREFLLLTIRAYIKKTYSDYFLDLIQLTSEKTMHVN